MTEKDLTARRWTVFAPTCPSRESLARIANKWTAMIVILLHENPRRFSQLHEMIGGISKKVLTDTLRALERDGMVEHVRDPGAPACYRLTPLGRTLFEPLLALEIWAEAHVDEVREAQLRYDRVRAEAVLASVDRWPQVGG